MAQFILTSCRSLHHVARSHSCKHNEMIHELSKAFPMTNSAGQSIFCHRATAEQSQKRFAKPNSVSLLTSFEQSSVTHLAASLHHWVTEKLIAISTPRLSLLCNRTWLEHVFPDCSLLEIPLVHSLHGFNQCKWIWTKFPAVALLDMKIKVNKFSCLPHTLWSSPSQLFYQVIKWWYLSLDNPKL